MHRVSIQDTVGSAVVIATGELDAFVAPELTSAFEEVDGNARLVVDLDGVSFMDSTALGALVRVAREREERGVEFRLVLPRGSARRIFEITALDRILPIAPDRDTALAQLADA